MELSELKNFDYLVMLMMGASVYFGWKAGFIESFISFFAWAGSAIIVADSYIYVYPIINSYIASKFISGFIASFVFYVALVIITLYFGTRISKTASKVGGGPIDKVAGGVFGVLRGACIAIAVFGVCYASSYTLNDKNMPKWLAEAKSYKVLKLGYDSLVSVLVSEEARENMLKTVMKKMNESDKEIHHKAESKMSEVFGSE